MLLTGWDEWFWTAHCWVDTYYGSAESIDSYDESELDGPTCRNRHEPVWNPRGYFLLALSHRFKQITREWAVIVRTIDIRLQAYVSHSLLTPCSTR